MSIKLDQCNPKLRERIQSQLRGESPALDSTITAKTLLSVICKTTDEEKLNKTEAAYLKYLRELNMKWIGIQNITLKLANDTRLTPDFSFIQNSGRFVFVDVKGFQREDALIKMKVAARQFPMFDFLIVKKAGTGWDTRKVKP